MPPQRVREDESRAGNRPSNGPLRAQSNAGTVRRVFCDVRQTLFAGDMMVSFRGHGLYP